MLLDDNPAIADRFGYQRYVDVLYNVIDRVESTPFCMGIFGPWGCGKTTLMGLLQKRLSADTPTIWFNPWKYDNKEAIWNALLQTVLYEMKRSLRGQQPREQNKQLLERISRVAKRLAWYALKTGADRASAGLVGGELLEDLKDAFTTAEESYDFINRFEDTFSELVDQYCGSCRLVIFIDDLDRCVPENAITVLEAIKLYLDKTRCILVLGLEKEIVEKGIKARYRSEIDFSGKDYLEKIIQLPFYLPAAQRADVEAFCREVPHPCIAPNKKEGLFYDILYSGTNGNIRKVKRFINTFNILKAISGIDSGDLLRMEILAKILLLQMNFPRYYREMEKDPALLSQFNSEFRQDSAPALRAFIDSDKQADLLRNFLVITKDVDDDPHLITECTALASQYCTF